MDLIQDYIDEFIFNCESRNLSDGTIKRYKKMLKIFKEYLDIKRVDDIEKIKVFHIRNFLIAQKQKGRKESYINVHLKVIRAFFVFLNEEEYLDDNPTEKVKFFKENKVIIKTFTDDEVLKMIEVADEVKYKQIKKPRSFSRYKSARNKLIIMLLADTAMRVNELCNIKNDDINKDRILIRKGKNNKERMVYLSSPILLQLMKFKRIKERHFQNTVTDDYLLINKVGDKMTVDAIQILIKKIGKEANIDKRCSPHTFRHYSAQALLKNGVDTYSVSRILGHTSTRITEVYLRSMMTDEVLAYTRNKSPLSLIKRKR